MIDLQDTDLGKFLFDYVEGVEDLRILGWFRQHGGTVGVALLAIEEATGLAPLVVSEVIERLVAKGVLERLPGKPQAFRYNPSDSRFSEMLDEALERYKTNSMDVLRVLSAHSIERVRIAALRTFAGAFRIKGPRDG